MPTQNKETQSLLTPQKALELLLAGNRRFSSNTRVNRDLQQQVHETSQGQFPFAIILSCIDSRTSVELVFDLGIGDVFNARIAGNISNEDILGSMEFACNVAGAKLILVLGHTKCGAVKGACAHVEMGNLTGLLDKIKPAVEEIQAETNGALSPAEFVEAVAERNVLHQMNAILKNSPILRDLYYSGKIGLVGAMYSVETGEVRIISEMFAYSRTMLLVKPLPPLDQRERYCS